MTTRIWIDVEDLFVYAAGQARPSGIQRLSCELCAALAGMDAGAGAISFVRHDAAAASFRVVPWSSVLALYGRMTRTVAPSAQTPVGTHRGPPRRLREIAFRLPPELRLPLTRFYVQQRAALGALGEFGHAARAARWRPLAVRASNADGDDAADADDPPFAARVRPGDILLAPGAHWYHPNYARLVEAARREHGIRFGLLVYDLIPLRRPEWCEPGLIRIFASYMKEVLPLADLILTISRATAADIVRHATDTGITLRSPPVVLPVGTGFGAFDAEGSADDGDVQQALPERPFVLAVSTVEARKNHVLLFHVWRRMLDELPRERVPTLVLAGRTGWLVHDLMAQLRNCAFLDGRIVQVEGPSDAGLARLYGACLFTVFPSFYEGWGLPVSESLAFGAPCIASSATSIPEAGGTLVRYFDPANITEAYRVIRAVLDDPADLAAWRARVAASFRPVPWAASAGALVDAVGALASS